MTHDVRPVIPFPSRHLNIDGTVPRRQEKREDTEDRRYEGISKPGASASAMNDTTTDMGVAVVEVLQVSARSGAEEGAGRSGGGDDVETDESEAGGGRGGRSRPVSRLETDVLFCNFVFWLPFRRG